MMTEQQVRAAQTVAISILETIAETDGGAPSGPMFAALQAQGCSLRQYNSLVEGLLKSGLATADYDETGTPLLFHITSKGGDLLQRIASKRAAT